jgi:sulfite reductase (ferredoxin)
VERLARNYLADRSSAQETFASWVIRADEELVK